MISDYVSECIANIDIIRVLSAFEFCHSVVICNERGGLFSGISKKARLFVNDLRLSDYLLVSGRVMLSHDSFEAWSKSGFPGLME